MAREICRGNADFQMIGRATVVTGLRNGLKQGEETGDARMRQSRYQTLLAVSASASQTLPQPSQRGRRLVARV